MIINSVMVPPISKDFAIMLVKHNALLVATIFLFLSTDSMADDPRSIQELDWLIGEWHFDDRSVDGHYVETGTRTCEYVLDLSHIRCSSLGKSNKGKERSYFFYFSYNRTDERFEIVGLNSHFPRVDLYAVTVSDSGDRLELVDYWFTNDGLLQHNIATITYDGSRQYVWEIRSGEIDAISGVPLVTFRDTATRID